MAGSSYGLIFQILVEEKRRRKLFGKDAVSKSCLEPIWLIPMETALIPARIMHG